MDIRSWQQKIIDDFPSIIEENRRFILKAPTGAGKTFLASELIKRFYNRKKVIVLCHRLVLLEQLEKALQKDHKILLNFLITYIIGKLKFIIHIFMVY